MPKRKKIYEVFIQDEWNNLTFLGFYENLDDSVNDINDYIEPTYGVRIKKGDVLERAGTFSSMFDTDLGDLFEDKEDLYGVMVRGFILDQEDFKSIKKRGGH